MVLRENVMAYVQGVYGTISQNSTIVDSPNMQNKIAQTLTCLFISFYASSWPSFFHDLLGLTATAGSPTKDNTVGVIFFQRVLIQIHDIIADVFVSRTVEERKTGNDLKDLIRERDAKMIATTWQEVMSQWNGKDTKVIEQCLAAIGKWVAWIDITLVITETLRSKLLELILSPTGQGNEAGILRESALATLTEILKKKMKPEYKLELIEFLKIREVIAHLAASPALAELRTTSNYDIELAESVGQLVNHSVTDIVRALDSAQDHDSTMTRGAAQLKDFLPLVLRFFSDEYDEICSTVIPCLTDLLTLFRKKIKSDSLILQQSATMLPSILDAVLMKTKYDETTTWGSEDAQTDEAEFQDLRKGLHVLQQAVAAVDETLYMDKISNVVISTFNNFQRQNTSVDWRDVDLALHEMFLFGELGLKNGGLYSKTKPVTPAAERLIGMMFKLVESSTQNSS